MAAMRGQHCYVDTGSYGECSAEDCASEDFVQLNFFEAIAAMVLSVDGIVKNQQKEHNCIHSFGQKTNMETNSTAPYLSRGSLLREFGEMDPMDVAIASMFIVYCSIFLIYLDLYFCMWRKPGISCAGLWLLPAGFVRSSPKVDASHSPDVRGSAQREPSLRIKSSRKSKGCRKTVWIKRKAWCLIFF